MNATIFLAVLLAALLHAIWNGLVKSSTDKLLSMTAVSFGGVPVSIVLLFLVPTPSLDCLPYLLASMFCHIAYQLSLILSYRLGDYTSVYPIARGSAPVWVTLVSIFLLELDFPPRDIMAIGLICLGIFLLSFVRQKDGFRSPKAIGAALLTGFFIATYSLLDGLGARAAGTSLGYLSWMMILDGIVFYICVCLYDRRVLTRVFTHEPLSFWVGGTSSTMAYGIVIWAMFTAPIALVVALREVSVLFALFIGVLFLGERLTYTKVIAILISVSGVILFRISA